MPDTATNLNNLVQGLVMLTMGVILFLIRREALERALRSQELFLNVKYSGEEPVIRVQKIIGKTILYIISFGSIIAGCSFVWTACRNLMR